MIGTSWLNRGTVACLPTRFLYRLSFGFTKTATQAERSSGRVVAIGRSLFSTLNFSVEKREGISLSSSSAWAIEVWHSGHHIVGKSFW